MSQETKLDCLQMTSPCCCSYMIQTYTQPFFFFFLPLGCLFKKRTRLKTKWHDTKNKVKPNRVKTKCLMCPWTSEWRSVSSDWTARCWQHPKWGKDMNLLTWKSQSTEAELGMNSQYVFLCVHERRRACEAVCLPPSAECVGALSLCLRLASARGLKSRGGRVDASLSSEGLL